MSIYVLTQYDVFTFYFWSLVPPLGIHTAVQTPHNRAVSRATHLPEIPSERLTNTKVPGKTFFHPRIMTAVTYDVYSYQAQHIPS